MKSSIRIILSIAIIALASCKKSNNVNNNNNNTSAYYINFKVNGAQHNNTNNLFGVSEPTDNDDVVTLITNDNNDTTQLRKGAILMVISSSKALKANDVYTTTPDDSGNNYLLITYSDGTYLYGNGDPVNPPNIKLTVKAATSTTLTGSFSGKIFDNTGNHSVNITDGTFNIKYFTGSDGVIKQKVLNLKIRVNK